MWIQELVYGKFLGHLKLIPNQNKSSFLFTARIHSVMQHANDKYTIFLLYGNNMQSHILDLLCLWGITYISISVCLNKIMHLRQSKANFDPAIKNKFW